MGCVGSKAAVESESKVTEMQVKETQNEGKIVEEMLGDDPFTDRGPAKSESSAAGIYEPPLESVADRLKRIKNGEEAAPQMNLSKQDSVPSTKAASKPTANVDPVVLEVLNKEQDVEEPLKQQLKPIVRQSAPVASQLKQEADKPKDFLSSTVGSGSNGVTLDSLKKGPVQPDIEPIAEHEPDTGDVEIEVVEKKPDLDLENPPQEKSPSEVPEAENQSGAGKEAHPPEKLPSDTPEGALEKIDTQVDESMDIPSIAAVDPNTGKVAPGPPPDEDYVSSVGAKEAGKHIILPTGGLYGATKPLSKKLKPFKSIEDAEADDGMSSPQAPQQKRLGSGKMSLEAQMVQDVHHAIKQNSLKSLNPVTSVETQE